VQKAREFLNHQWPVPLPTIGTSEKEYVAMLTKWQKQVKQPKRIDIENMHRHLEEQYALIEEMQQWLDKYLKN
jgi:hypothetical protein